LSRRRASSKGQAFEVIAASRSSVIGVILRLVSDPLGPARTRTYCSGRVASINTGDRSRRRTDTMTDHALNPQDALVAIMVAVSVSDETIRTAELVKIEQIVNNLPVFGDYDADRTRAVAQTVFELFEDEDGLDALFGLVHEALPERLWETAYAIACDVAAADGTILQTELRFLEELRHALNIDRLHAAAIERGARARHMTL
jgi:tellurite resistance protein